MLTEMHAAVNMTQAAAVNGPQPQDMLPDVARSDFPGCVLLTASPLLSRSNDWWKAHCFFPCSSKIEEAGPVR